ncbi:MAG: single-stranded-DNA-specific exonuclease RecJ, partial [Pseudomonadota bacterium]
MSESLVLDVQKSLKETRWVFPKAAQDDVTRIAQTNDLPEFVARLLTLRGVAADDVKGFLHPTLREHFPDPFSLEGMKELAEDLSDAIIHERPIGIFADFDVDGATSSSILKRFFRYFGQEVPVYIPDRLCEGYGPSAEALQALKDQGAEFVLIVDCGITAFDAVQAGRDMGLDIAVLDHHEPEDKLPNATHVIDPKREDDNSGLDMLAACGVAFMTCVAVNKVLREREYFDGERSEPNLKGWMDIVALGTVCDMVPMRGVNRLFVRTGFEQMAQMNNAGIKALCEVANIQDAPTVQHAGWSLGPRINAGSRVHRSDLGSKLLSTDDLEEARSIAWTLEDCNKERKAIQSSMMDSAIQKVTAEALDQYPIIVVGDTDWHPGLSGLVAGRLKERFGKPAVCVTYAENPDGVLEGRGSGRSVPGFSMADAFIKGRNKGLLVQGGGHAMAGGFTIVPDKLPEFREFLYQNVKEQLEAHDPTTEILIDSIATIQGARADWVKMVTQQV